MITLKPIAWRLIVLAPAFSLFSVTCFSQDTEETVHVSDATSIGYELAECNPDDPDPAMKAYCAGLKDVEGAIKKCQDGSITRDSCPKVMMTTTRVEPPIVCPRGHCLPFHQIPRVCFFSEKDLRRVKIFVNNKLIGSAKNVSYNSKTKERTVFFDLKKNFKNTKGTDQNVMMVRFPVTYNKSGKHVQSVLVFNTQF